MRWGEGVERLKLERELLVGDCLLAASFISYIGPFTKQYRETLVRQTLIPLVVLPPVGSPIPMTEDIDPIAVMCTEAEIAEYQTQVCFSLYSLFLVCCFAPFLVVCFAVRSLFRSNYRLRSFWFLSTIVRSCRQGLPADRVSAENGAIVLNSIRYKQCRLLLAVAQLHSPPLQRRSFTY